MFPSAPADSSIAQNEVDSNFKYCIMVQQMDHIDNAS